MQRTRVQFLNLNRGSSSNAGNLKANPPLFDYPFEISIRSYEVVEEADVLSTAAFMRRCLRLDPKKRASAAELLSDPWFDGVDWGALESKSIEGPINPGITEDGQHKFIKGAPPIMMQSDLDVDLNEVFKDF